MNGELKTLLTSDGAPRIAVIGDIILDEFVWGDVKRISPEAPVPVVEVSHESEHPGGAANVVHNLRKLGAEPRLFGVVGDDAAGRRLLAVAEKEGISTEGILTVPGRRTTQKTRILAHHQQVCRADREDPSPLSTSTAETLIRQVLDILTEIDAVILSDYAKGVLQDGLVKTISAEARARRIFTAVDPKRSDLAFYSGVSLVTPNQREAEMATNRRVTDAASLQRICRQIRKDADADAVLVTRGEAGMALYHEGRLEEIEATAREVFDVTGAGDTVIATLTLSVARGASLMDAARLANLAGGISVGKLGTAAVSLEELLAAF